MLSRVSSMASSRASDKSWTEKMSKMSFKKKKSSSSDRGSTPVISNANRKQFGGGKTPETGSTSTSEVGSRTLDSATASISDDSPSPARLAALGLQFHPAVGGGGSFASTADNDEDEYLSTPSKYLSAPSNPAGKSPKTPNDAEKSSPKSVILEENRPRRGKKGRKGQRRELRSESSYYDSETMTGDEASVESATHPGNESLSPQMLAQALVGMSIEKVHNFITGNACWSGGKAVVRRVSEVQTGCQDAIDEMVLDENEFDDDITGSEGGSTWESTVDDTLSWEERAARKKRKGKQKGKKSSRQLESLDSRSLASSRRGRSRKPKQGHNSDSREGSLSTRGASLSLSLSRNSSPSLTESGRSRSRGQAVARKPPLQRFLESSGNEWPTAAESVLSHDQEAWMAMTAQSKRDEATLPVEDAKDEEYGAELSGESPAIEKDDSPIDKLLQILLSVGIPLTLNEVRNAWSEKNDNVNTWPSLNRTGNMFLQFVSEEAGQYEHSQLVWSDGHDLSYTLDLRDIQSIREPTPFEQESYSFGAPAQSFIVSTNDGTLLLFETEDEEQMRQITESLNAVVSKLAREDGNDWVAQKMLQASSGGQEAVENVAEVTDPLTNECDATTLMMRAQKRRERREKRRSMKG